MCFLFWKTFQIFREVRKTKESSCTPSPAPLGRPRPVPAAHAGGRAGGPAVTHLRAAAAASVPTAPSAVTRSVSRVSRSGTASRSLLVAGTARVCETSSPRSARCPLGVCVVRFFADWVFGFGGDVTPQRVCLLLTPALGCALSPGLWGRASAAWSRGHLPASCVVPSQPPSCPSERAWSPARAQGEGSISLWGGLVFSARSVVSSVSSWCHGGLTCASSLLRPLRLPCLRVSGCQTPGLPWWVPRNLVHL